MNNQPKCGSNLPDTKTNIHKHPLYGINAGAFRCNLCYQEYWTTPAFRYHCTICDFDVCPTCWNRPY